MSTTETKARQVTLVSAATTGEDDACPSKKPQKEAETHAIAQSRL